MLAMRSSVESVKQRWQDGHVADDVVGCFDGPDLERARVDHEMHLAIGGGSPCRTFCLPSPFTCILIPLLSTSRDSPVMAGTASTVTCNFYLE